jgi:hypothetical protein
MLRHDLHIDAVSKKYRHPSTWSSAVGESLKVALETLQAEKLPIGISVSIRLRDSPTPTGLIIKTPEDLQAELDDHQSPSLYLFPKDKAVPLIHLVDGVVGRDILGYDIPGALVTYNEGVDEDGQYTRFLSIWCPCPDTRNQSR